MTAKLVWLIALTPIAVLLGLVAYILVLAFFRTRRRARHEAMKAKLFEMDGRSPECAKLYDQYVSGQWK